MELEYYFIQFLFTMNYKLLMYENKELYKTMFDRYKEEFEKLKTKMFYSEAIDTLNKNFVNMILRVRNRGVRSD